MTQKEKKAKSEKTKDDFLVAIRLRGTVGLDPNTIETFNSLNLPRKYNAVFLQKRPEIDGMLKKVKDFITWGEVNKESMEMVLRKRGRLTGNKKLTNEFVKEKLQLNSIEEVTKALWDTKMTLKHLRDVGVRPVFRLHPPKGGFKKSTKRSYKSGGELGYRQDNINELLKKMA
ncbi:50S ribosomal protein L30 [[Eubacterium] cellulosolvens]